MLSEILVGSIEPFIEEFGLSQFFVGVVLIPTIGNLAEHLVAVQLAYKNKMEFAMAVATARASRWRSSLRRCSSCSGSSSART